MNDEPNKQTKRNTRQLFAKEAPHVKPNPAPHIPSGPSPHPSCRLTSRSSYTSLCSVTLLLSLSLLAVAGSEESSIHTAVPLFPLAAYARCIGNKTVSGLLARPSTYPAALLRDIIVAATGIGLTPRVSRWYSTSRYEVLQS